MLTVDQVTPPCAYHGEGPVWHEGWGGLRCVDMLAGDVLCVDTTSGSHDRIHVSNVAAAVRPRSSGGMVVATERGFALVRESGKVDQLDELWSDPSIRMNDGGCDPSGAFYCGSMAYDMRPGAGRLYRLNTDLTTSVVIGSVTVSNGLAWSPDGSVAYYVDSPTQRIDMFEYSPARGLESRRPAVRVDARYGMPDGLTVDCAGNLWVALWGGGAVHCYTPQGELLERIELPVRQVTACVFGGADLGDLYITTSQLQDSGGQPGAGAIYRARPGATGVPALSFAA